MWSINGSRYDLRPDTPQTKHLPNGVYILQWDLKINDFFLTRLCEKFEFTYKLYDLDEEFIEHAVKTANNTKDNIGVLLSGVKGCGKTVTAKQLSNKLQRPTILIEKSFSDLNPFIAKIEQEVIIFIDEIEKVFRDNDSQKLLSLMDGTINNGYRRFFLLTCNTTDRMDVNLFNRPGRIRFLKHYDGISLNAILEITEDLLKNKTHKDNILKFLSKCELLTIDVVKTVIEETNIHDQDPETFKNILNIKQLYDIEEYNGTELIKLTDEELKSLTQDHPHSKTKLVKFTNVNYDKIDSRNGFHDSDVKNWMRLGRIEYHIAKVFAPNIIVVKVYDETESNGDSKEYRFIYISTSPGINKVFKNYTF